MYYVAVMPNTGRRPVGFVNSTTTCRGRITAFAVVPDRRRAIGFDYPEEAEQVAARLFDRFNLVTEVLPA